MKWWFNEKRQIETSLSPGDAMARIKTIARERHRIIDTLNPDAVFTDSAKPYVGTMGERAFRLKRKYYYSRGQTMGLIIRGTLEDDARGSVLSLTFTVPPGNFLWLLFPPLWMLIGFTYTLDYTYLHRIPGITLIALLGVFYLYWMVLAQFRRKATGALADFQQALAGNTSFFYGFSRTVVP